MDKKIRLGSEIVLIAFCIIFNLLLISNPGFFSHDELQKTDYIYRTGFSQYVKDLGVFHVGKHFGEPIRPLSFIIQGVQGLFIYDFPIVTHSIDILLHISCVLLLYWLVLEVSKNKRLSFLSAIFFSISPLALFSVGWSAALMDRLFTLFSLIIILFSYRYLNNSRWRSLIVIIAALFLGIASKETMIMIPAIVIVVVFWNKQNNKEMFIDRNSLKLLSVVTMPVILYLIYRLPSIISTIHGQGGAYEASINNILPNSLIYFTYPFLLNLGEASGIILMNKLFISFAFFMHLILLFLMYRIYGIRNAIYYLLFYFIPLIPIISLASVSSIYLYASAVIFSIAIASLVIYVYDQKPRSLFVLLVISSVVIMVVVHAFYIQKFFYSYGVCMNKALISLESEYLHNDKNASIIIHSDKGAPKYIMDRIVYGRAYVGKFSSINLKSTDDKTWTDDKALHLHFSKNCIVY